MKRFLLIALTIVLFNAYIALRIAMRWPAAAAHPVLDCVLVVVFALLEVAGPFGDDYIHSLSKKPWAAILARVFSWVAYMSLGIFSVLLIYTLVADVVALVWRWILPPQDLDAFQLRVLLVTLAATAATIVIGLVQTFTGPVIKKVTIPLKGLPQAFDGFRIVQITDLHVGPTIGRSYTEKVVGMANSLSPDLLALTGDFIDGSVAQLLPGVEPLANLRAPYGIYYVPGNHEYYWGVDEWVAEFKKLGARPLMNQHEVVKRGADEIIIAGVTDYSTLHMTQHDRMSPEKSLIGAPAGLVRILLAHQSASYDLASKAGFDLQLSGHTHGGQYFPFSLMIGWFQRYHGGLDRHGDMQIYTSHGTGYWGPPLRTFVPSEITLLTLKAV